MNIFGALIFSFVIHGVLGGSLKASSKVILDECFTNMTSTQICRDEFSPVNSTTDNNKWCCCKVINEDCREEKEERSESSSLAPRSLQSENDVSNDADVLTVISILTHKNETTINLKTTHENPDDGVEKLSAINSKDESNLQPSTTSSVAPLISTEADNNVTTTATTSLVANNQDLSSSSSSSSSPPGEFSTLSAISNLIENSKAMENASAAQPQALENFNETIAEKSDLDEDASGNKTAIIESSKASLLRPADDDEQDSLNTDVDTDGESASKRSTRFPLSANSTNSIDTNEGSENSTVDIEDLNVITVKNENSTTVSTEEETTTISSSGNLDSSAIRSNDSQENSPSLENPSANVEPKSLEGSSNDSSEPERNLVTSDLTLSNSSLDVENSTTVDSITEPYSLEGRTFENQTDFSNLTSSAESENSNKSVSVSDSSLDVENSTAIDSGSESKLLEPNSDGNSSILVTESSIQSTIISNSTNPALNSSLDVENVSEDQQGIEIRADSDDITSTVQNESTTSESTTESITTIEPSTTTSEATTTTRARKGVKRPKSKVKQKTLQEETQGSTTTPSSVNNDDATTKGKKFTKKKGLPRKKNRNESSTTIANGNLDSQETSTSTIITTTSNIITTLAPELTEKDSNSSEVTSTTTAKNGDEDEYEYVEEYEDDLNTTSTIIPPISSTEIPLSTVINDTTISSDTTSTTRMILKSARQPSAEAPALKNLQNSPELKGNESKNYLNNEAANNLRISKDGVSAGANVVGINSDDGGKIVREKVPETKEETQKVLEKIPKRSNFNEKPVLEATDQLENDVQAVDDKSNLLSLMANKEGESGRKRLLALKL